MRACWLKWVGRDWSISADYIWLNYSGANTAERNSIFGNKTAGRRSLKQGSGRQFSVFHRTFGIARRKYAANSRILEHTAVFA